MFSFLVLYSIVCADVLLLTLFDIFKHLILAHVIYLYIINTVIRGI